MTERANFNLMALDAELSTLEGPSTPDAFVAMQLFPGSTSRLMHGFSGEVSLLIAGGDGVAGPDLKLRNITARVNVCCKVELPDGSSTALEGAMVTCTAPDPQLRRLFLHLMEDALEELGKAPTALSIASWLHRIAALFAKLEQSGRTRLRGLWAELVVMLALGDSTLCLRRWHTDPRERFDFLAGNFALEVKSCQDSDRVHHFSLDQLRPPNDLDVWIASVIVRSDPQGQSVLDLLQELESQVSDAPTRDFLREMVISSGGSALQDDDLHRFDKACALSTLHLMGVNSIPSITCKLPDEIMAVSLQIRCRDLPSIGSAAEARSRLGAAPFTN